MVYLLGDTSVWLDLAKNISGEKLIVAVRVLVHENRLQLLVPRLVIEEFDRNRGRIETDMTRSVSAQFGRVRAAINEHGQGRGRDAALKELDNLRHRVPLINQMAARNFDDVRQLLVDGAELLPTAADFERVVQRGLQKQAPFHRSRNSVADAVLLELYRTHLADPGRSSGDQHCFVSSNIRDFSTTHGDDRLPHPDLADLFATSQSHYFTALSSALDTLFPAEFDELLEEVGFEMEPRTYDQIRQAELELFDRIWYDRSLGHEQNVDDIEALREIAGPGRARVEATYGIETLGPYDNFERGMLNGKLSALRWVLGDEWDFLDT